MRSDPAVATTLDEARKQEREHVCQILTDIGYFETPESCMTELDAFEKEKSEAAKLYLGRKEE